MDMFLSGSLLIDDLLNVSNVDLTTIFTDSHRRHLPILPPPQNPFHQSSSSGSSFNNPPSLSSANLTADLSIPNDDVAHLEWLSEFMDGCFHDEFPTIGETMMMTSSSVPQSDASFASKADHHGKRSRAASGKPRPKTEPNGRSYAAAASAAAERSGVRRCTHCASEKTPQWRSGPLGPKTLCNACGVRYKSGRLVPEYRPASSPTFVLSQHSNSHRKVLELRRQKEMGLVKQEAQPE
ncbi:GATA transcription factor 2-like [Neltuma alba]|uniref:GATA transcription factor 2-like n=1 Tax=Neltuma alba TaxID=207710 RepID=UPI0010A2EDFF|nr:GATA transcription factor 2-like [Prosopis alba]